jgi:ferritin-like metal-binding protein YciE
MPIETLDELLIEEIKDLYDAEKQLTKALPKLAKAASNPELKAAFTEHLEQTKGHVSRLEQVFEHLGVKPKGKPCAAMKGLIEEGQEQTQEDAEGAIMDLMLIAAAQKVEHYEMSGYGSVRAMAEAMGNEDVAELLRQTEEEESEADEKLTGIAETLLEEASGGEEEEEESDEDGDEEEEEEEEEEPVAAPVKATAKRGKTKA